MISASFLSIKDNLKENIKVLDNTTIDMLHVDIMDGVFVPNKTWNIFTIKELLSDTKSRKDVHLMVCDVLKYIDDFKTINPDYITFHYEAIDNIYDTIMYIKSLNIKVGLSIKPNTSVNDILPYLPYLDLVLVMSVEPGLGGQIFIENSVNKINMLYDLREKNNYHYLIEVDGGINDKTYKLCNKADILVVGSFITNGNYQEQIDKIRIKKIIYDNIKRRNV